MIGQLVLEVLDQADGVFGILLAHDRDLLVFVLDGVAREHRALEGIDEADAGIPLAVQGDGRIGGGRRQRGDLLLAEDLAARHRQAGGIGAQHGDDALVHQGLRGQRRLGAVGLVVAIDQLDLLAQHLGVELVGQVVAFLFHGAAGGGRAGHRLKDANLDGLLRQREHGAEHGESQNESQNLLHTVFPPES